MLEVNHIDSNIMEIIIESSLTSQDFKKVSVMADNLIKEHGKIKILINAVSFNGWDDFTAAQKHLQFVKGHHQKVEKLAFVAGHNWQTWVAAMASIFVNPEIKVFDKNELKAAKSWLQA